MKPKFFNGPTEATPIKEYLESLDVQDVDTLYQFGCLYLNSNRINPLNTGLDKVLVGEGDILKVFSQPKRFPAAKLSADSILQENERLIALNKPSGVPSLPVASNLIENCKHFLELRHGSNLYPLHRLDEGTSGVLVFGKAPEVATEFHRDHQNSKIEKIYECLTSSKVPTGTHRHFLQKGDDRMLCLEEGSAEAKEAILEVLSCKKSDKVFRSSIRLVTGRTHQIRCQLSFLGHPILGDDIYGEKESANRLMLHAKSLIWNDLQIKSHSDFN